MLKGGKGGWQCAPTAGPKGAREGARSGQSNDAGAAWPCPPPTSPPPHDPRRGRPFLSHAHTPSPQSSVALLAAIADPPARGLARAVYDSVAPAASFFDALGLPAPLVHWGHPGNMAVVFLAMGVYGCGALGATIRYSDDAAAVVKAKDLHPKLAVGMGLFFALGGVGGLMSLTMQGKPILQSPHVVTGLLGLLTLAFQGMLSAFFADSPGARDAHAYLGAALLALFGLHMVFGIQLGLSI